MQEVQEVQRQEVAAPLALGIVEPPPPADEAAAAALAAALRQQTPAAAATSPGPAPAGPAPDALQPRRQPSWCGMVGQAAARGIVEGCGLYLREVKRLDPGPADPERVDRIGEILRDRLATWFPDSELPWWGELLFLVATVYAGMRATALPLSPAANDNATPPPAPPADSAA